MAVKAKTIQAGPIWGWVFILALAPALCAAAEESPHERIGVERKAAFELSFDLSASMGRISESRGFGVDAGLDVEFLYDARASLRLSLPVDLRFGGTDTRLPRWAADLGDLGIGLAYSGRIGPWRPACSLSFSSPLEAPDAGRLDRTGLDSGAGYATLGIGGHVARFLDPLSLGLDLEASTSFPRLERYGAASRPISLSSCLSLTEALNGRTSLSISARQSLHSPRILGDAWESESWAYSLDIGLSLFLVIGDGGLRLGFSGFEDSRLNCGASYAFRFPYPSGELAFRPTAGPK